jgi:hypothetical protein
MLKVVMDMGKKKEDKLTREEKKRSMKKKRMTGQRLRSRKVGRKAS